MSIVNPTALCLLNSRLPLKFHGRFKLKFHLNVLNFLSPSKLKWLWSNITNGGGFAPQRDFVADNLFSCCHCRQGNAS